MAKVLPLDPNLGKPEKITQLRARCDEAEAL